MTIWVSACLQTDRYAEYPKLKELVERKDGLIATRATPPMFLKVCCFGKLKLISVQLCEYLYLLLYLMN